MDINKKTYKNFKNVNPTENLQELKISRKWKDNFEHWP
jgi:hypothetical protein